MAESKRIFAKGRMNRDIDDRLLPEGEYRDALNVNVGKSEGGDIGAVENLKGNMEIPNQTGVSGTTIGVVRDPNEDRIYWFNTSATADGIYEYDQSTGEVNTLVQDIKRDVPLPTCAPTITIAAIEPDSITPNRPGLPGLPAVPTGVCTNPAATNAGTLGPRNFADNGLCTFPPTWRCTGGDGSGTCSEFTDGQGGTATQSECENASPCAPSGGGGGGGAQAIRVAVEGAECDTTGNTAATIDLTVQVTQGNPGFPVTVDITNGPSGIELTALNTPVTFTVNNPGTDMAVVYRPSATESGGRQSTINEACSIGWGTAVLPSASFNCNGAGTGSCSDPGDGTGAFSDQATCEADASCAAATAEAECNEIPFDNQHGTIIISHIVCRNDVCILAQPSFNIGADIDICIQRLASPVCNNTLTTATVGSVTLPLNGIGYVVSTNIGATTFINAQGVEQGLLVTPGFTGSCTP